MLINQKGFSVIEGLLILVIVAIIGGAGWYVYDQRQESEPKKASVTNFEECKAAGYPIGESYPEQCFAPDQTFVNEAQKPLIDSSESDATVFKIEELGVQFELTPKLEGLYYHYSSQDATVYLSVEELRENSCAADAIAIVAVKRVHKNDVDFNNLDDGLNISKVLSSGYAYSAKATQAGCSIHERIQTKATEVQKELLTILPAALTPIQ